MSVKLPQDQIEALKELKSTHDIIEQEISRAESAGLDMSEYRAKLDQMENIRQGLLKVYGTGSRRKSI